MARYSLIESCYARGDSWAKKRYLQPADLWINDRTQQILRSSALLATAFLPLGTVTRYLYYVILLILNKQSSVNHAFRTVVDPCVHPVDPCTQSQHECSLWRTVWPHLLWQYFWRVLLPSGLLRLYACALPNRMPAWFRQMPSQVVQQARSQGVHHVFKAFQQL